MHKEINHKKIAKITKIAMDNEDNVENQIIKKGKSGKKELDLKGLAAVLSNINSTVDFLKTKLPTGPVVAERAIPQLTPGKIIAENSREKTELNSGYTQDVAKEVMLDFSEPANISILASRRFTKTDFNAYLQRQAEKGLNIIILEEHFNLIKPIVDEFMRTSGKPMNIVVVHFPRLQSNRF